MAKSPTDRITALEILVSKLDERLDNVRVETGDLGARRKQSEKDVAELQKEAALVRQTLDELRKSRELWSNRGWAIINIVLTCLITLIITQLRK